ncbi:hypothetical protein ACIQAC_37055 [Streptomyces sp. NPDC088387]|uniref:Rv1733c family protein n=1 Tax=Streptomyces sp. NPDC088387 TaxID=3365859 RepID=UPI0037FC0CD7
MAFRGRQKWLWRWRSNPLRRPSDRTEAWVVLATWALTVLVGALGGLATAGSVEHSLARERAEWRPVTARLTGDAPGTARGSSGVDRVWAEVGWTAPDGSARSGQARVVPGSGEGSAVTVWTDPNGRLVTEPASAAQARVRSSAIGCLAGLSAAMLPIAAGGMVRARMERRRLDQWDTDWAHFDALRGRQTG